MQFKDYVNKISNSNRIYTKREIREMKLKDFFAKKKELLSQYDAIGLPKPDELKNSPNVNYVEDSNEVFGGRWESVGVNGGTVTTQPQGFSVNAGTAGGSPNNSLGLENQSQLQPMQNLGKNENRGIGLEGFKVESVPNVLSSANIFPSENVEGTLAGAALPIVDRMQETPWENQNNDILFENEANKKMNWLMRTNHNMNSERPDAKLFMDLALIGPKRVPSCRDYQFMSSEKVGEFNKVFGLTGNKKIDSNYDGFIFSETSGTARRLNESEEFRSQILKPENYDAEKGVFKRDKLEIELKNDKNLGYSFGHMTVIPKEITPDGYLVGVGFDKYNYNLHLKEYLNHKDTTILNNEADILQFLKLLKNYYVFVPVKVKIR